MLKSLLRLAGLAAAIAVGGLAIRAVTKLAEDTGAEKAEKADAKENAEGEAAPAYSRAVYEAVFGDADVPEADAGAEAKAVAAPEADAGAETDAAAAEAKAAADTEAEAKALAAPAGPDTPNVNPVSLGKPVAPRTADGKIDVTKIATPEDFGSWDDLGCQG